MHVWMFKKIMDSDLSQRFYKSKVQHEWLTKNSGQFLPNANDLPHRSRIVTFKLILFDKNIYLAKYGLLKNVIF